MYELNIFSLFNFFAAILIGSLGLVIFLGSHTHSSRAFVHNMFWVAAWIAGVGLLTSTTNAETSLIYSRLTYYLGSTIAAGFFYFFLTYPENKSPNKLIPWLLLVLQILLCYVFIFTDKIIYNTEITSYPNVRVWEFGTLSFIFELFFFGFFISGIGILYMKFRKCRDMIAKANLKFMLWVIIVGATPPSLMCIILPRFGYYDLNWLGPITEII